MSDPLKFALAISLTESNADAHAFGDGGLALTSYQCHPAWVWQWATKFNLAPRVSYSWESWVGEIVQRFYLHCVELNLTPVEAAMYFHLGHVGQDAQYGDKFLVHWNRLS